MKKEKSYTGENEKWFLFNDLITIRREIDGVPYLIRRTLLAIGKWFSIKWHKILVSDDFCHHDHPWPFITLILRGGYYEWTPSSQKDNGIYIDERINENGIHEVCHFHAPGSIMYRPAKWVHRLELMKKDGIEVPATTFVITGKVIRDWGFFTKQGWIFWKNYTQEKYC